MSANLPALDDPKIQWKEVKSRNGAPYRVGVLSTEGTDEEKAGVAGGGAKANLGSIRVKEDFGVDVDWSVDGIWHETKSDLKSLTGISSYCVSKNDNFVRIYDYTIAFYTGETYDYHFEDETGDRYECDVCQNLFNTSHYVSYNSKKPKIINITGK